MEEAASNTPRDDVEAVALSVPAPGPRMNPTRGVAAALLCLMLSQGTDLNGLKECRRSSYLVGN
jgi:hypothetical protein